MRRSVRVWALCSALLLLVGAACTQGEQGVCQVDADCDSPLVCHRAAGNDRGTCQRADAVRPDLTPTPGMDAATTEPVLPPDPVVSADSEDAG